MWLSEGGMVCGGGYYGDICLCLAGIYGAMSAFLLLLLLLSVDKCTFVSCLGGVWSGAI